MLGAPRFLLAFAIATSVVGTADARPTRKVRIATEPAGATVYVGSVEDGPACTPTPCSIEVSPGEHALVIDLAEHQRLYEGITVPKRGRVPDYRWSLTPALGTIVIDGPQGAMVSVDGEERGRAPKRIEVSAEAHRVVVTVKGKPVYDDYVEVAAGEELDLKPRTAGDPDDTPPDEDPDEIEPPDDTTTDDTEEDLSTSRSASSERLPYVGVYLATDIAFRRFSYDNAMSAGLSNITEGGQLLVGPLVELWPGRLAGIRALRGLTVFGRYQYGLLRQEVRPNGVMLMMEVTSFWQLFEAGVRQRWTIRDRFTAEVGVGYLRDQLEFNGFETDLTNVPGAQYSVFRIGGRGSILVDAGSVRFEPYLSAENRIVGAGGRVSERFDSAKASGFAGALGVGVRRGRIVANLEASITRYAWTFQFSPDAMYKADGATDRIVKVAIGLGVTY